ncbi:MAG: aminotransferase class V-fold PLP-dependent enzyme [Ruminococcus bicirculans (ex Wegman et al. 2014)]
MKIPVKAKKLNADMISLSGHKIYAPKGIGVLYVKKGRSYTAFYAWGRTGKRLSFGY